MITDEMIDIAIKNAPKDQYGQTRAIDKQPSRLFPDNTKEVLEHLKTSKKYMISTYGGNLGIFQAICRRH